MKETTASSSGSDWRLCRGIAIIHGVEPERLTDLPGVGVLSHGHDFPPEGLRCKRSRRFRDPGGGFANDLDILDQGQHQLSIGVEIAANSSIVQTTRLQALLRAYGGNGFRHPSAY